jgi:hypothetical protein
MGIPFARRAALRCSVLAGSSADPTTGGHRGDAMTCMDHNVATLARRALGFIVRAQGEARLQRSIVPLSEVPRARVEDYLRASTSYFRGRDSAAIGWKYYDEAFNRGRNRGFAWVKDGRVRGFIGIVPGLVARGSEVVPLHWTCDWGLEDPKATPGMGILLLRRVTAAGEHAATMGGNANTRTLVPRLAARSFEGAGLHLWRPLRTAALLHLAAARAPVLGRLAPTALGKLPLPWLVRRPRRHVRITEGVAPSLDALFDAQRPTAWTARYDVPHLQWALERCPGIVSGSCYVEGDRGPVAGAVLWHSSASAIRHVRFALWATPGADDAAAQVVGEVIRCARSRGGALISALVGRWDTAELAVLRRAGFFPRAGPLPLYVFAHAGAGPGAGPGSGRDDRLGGGLGGLNYLATDLAQRFRSTSG